MQDKLGAVFDMDNPLMRVLGTGTDLIILNAVTVLCMVPVVTYGAALTARDDILWHMVRGEETYIIKSYFKSFKRNLRQGTLMGIFFLILAGLLVFDFNMVRAVPAAQSLIYYAIILFVAVFVLAVGIYAFALLSRYENSIPATLKTQ